MLELKRLKAEPEDLLGELRALRAEVTRHPGAVEEVLKAFGAVDVGAEFAVPSH
ncbi:hypothetical protein Adeg_0878 [Ammonifex degensii KC4]|uniref:Uncharacterized protein n=1 Tax=Ammonifex degensii (strain DSM 10501 / KC4) TaxID=429009 RepID=C9RCP0_AMMDK|nr:hypothetical protein [Ammonifex degensii]ACX52017.1 hypothetical protein Adeg_0878 [Ammonifex degensii KC4]